MKGWHTITKWAQSEREFLDRWDEVKKDLVQNELHPWTHTTRDDSTIQCLQSAFQYIDQNKIPLRQRFAGYAIDQHCHLGNTSTSRAEGAHWTSIKCHLRRARGTLLDVYDRIDRSSQQRQWKIDDEIARERVEILTLPNSIFELVLRSITHHALKGTLEEYKMSLHPEQLRPCSGYHERALGLPCAHTILRILQTKTQLNVNSFHVHWRKISDRDPDIHGVLHPFRVERRRGRPAKPATTAPGPPTHQRKSKRSPSAFEYAEHRASARSCGNCNQPGHNKRTCKEASTKSSTDNGDVASTADRTETL